MWGLFPLQIFPSPPTPTSSSMWGVQPRLAESYSSSHFLETLVGQIPSFLDMSPLPTLVSRIRSLLHRGSPQLETDLCTTEGHLQRECVELTPAPSAPVSCSCPGKAAFAQQGFPGLGLSKKQQIWTSAQAWPVLAADINLQRHLQRWGNSELDIRTFSKTFN